MQLIGWLRLCGGYQLPPTQPPDAAEVVVGVQLRVVDTIRGPRDRVRVATARRSGDRVAIGCGRDAAQVSVVATRGRLDRRLNRVERRGVHAGVVPLWSVEYVSAAVWEVRASSFAAASFALPF